MADLEKTVTNIVEWVNKIEAADWASIISAICSAISLIAIVVLLIERCEKKRPYLQISFELIRSSLVCLVIRNVGEVPAVLNEITFNPEFVKQMPTAAQRNARNRTNLNISLHPKQQWVLCLDETTMNVLKYQDTRLEVGYAYSAKGKRRAKYRDTEVIEFTDYERFMVYISEIDDLKYEIRSLTKATNATTRLINRLANQQQVAVQTESYQNVGDDYTQVKITEWEENTILQKNEENGQEN